MANDEKNVNIDEKNAESPQGDGKVKKPRLKKFQQNEEPIKVNLAEPKEEEVKEEQPKEEVKQEETPVVEEIVEEKKEEVVEEKEAPVVEEITDEEVEEKVEEVQEAVEEAIEEAEKTGEELPENIQKLMKFMDETGGDLEDYVKLNQDYSKFDDTALLREYYRQTKPHLSSDEIDFLMEDSFTFDEEVDDPKNIKRKKLAFKEQVADARAQLDRQKSKYYEEINAGVKLTPDQQKAIDFFNRYNKERSEQDKIAQQQKSTFQQKTKDVFNKNFKGFEYNIGEKRFRFNVKDAGNIKEQQSDINNFVNKFVDNKSNTLSDAKGYHKSLFTAMNADAVANHFYEQGRADAIKESIAKAKNVSMEPRQGLGEVEAGGMKVKILQDNDMSSFRFKPKTK
tara:strand:+ start:817 stop:2004 length:1188 start_codon:yes stop_codon:yes gene_type:complete